MGVSQKFWAGRSVLLTGHTGFKGSWAAFWLSQMGANVTGYALAPSSVQALYRELDIGEIISVDHRADINDSVALDRVISDVKPEVVIHMAAQAIVRESYLNPLETYITNVIGTVRLLEAVRRSKSVKSVVVVTSDKCYENTQTDPSYFVETDRLGGADPYSSSKACAELVTQAYRDSFFAGPKDKLVGLATARAGNVIGGGDKSAYRLIPDVVRAINSNIELEVRNLESVRPWQHVLDPLSGYLLLSEKLFNNPRKFSGAWNFGPTRDAMVPVRTILEKVSSVSGVEFSWRKSEVENNLYEAPTLKLDASKARKQLDWQPVWGLETSIMHTIEWYQAQMEGHNMIDETIRQIKLFGGLLD